MWLFIGIFCLNLLISFLNARTVGLMWAESKYYGGWTRFMAWCGGIMSAIGFTWCYFIVFGFGGYFLDLARIALAYEPIGFGIEEVVVLLNLGYLIIGPLVVITGFMIWIDSLVQAWKRRDIASGGVAVWNTFSQVHNTYNLIQTLPDAFGVVWDFFFSDDSDSDDDSGLGWLIIVLGILAILAGCATTVAIVQRYASVHDLPEKPDIV